MSEWVMSKWANSQPWKLCSELYNKIFTYLSFIHEARSLGTFYCLRETVNCGLLGFTHLLYMVLPSSSFFFHVRCLFPFPYPSFLFLLLLSAYIFYPSVFSFFMSIPSFSSILVSIEQKLWSRLACLPASWTVRNVLEDFALYVTDGAIAKLYVT